MMLRLALCGLQKAHAGSSIVAKWHAGAAGLPAAAAVTFSREAWGQSHVSALLLPAGTSCLAAASAAARAYQRSSAASLTGRHTGSNSSGSNSSGSSSNQGQGPGQGPGQNSSSSSSSTPDSTSSSSSESHSSSSSSSSSSSNTGSDRSSSSFSGSSGSIGRSTNAWSAAVPQQQQQQQQSGGTLPVQYKIVQYNKGSQITLAVTTETPDGYTLQRSKGAASSREFVATRPGAGDGSSSSSLQQQAAPMSPVMALLQRPLRRVRKTLQATFLPAGYPTSVGSNYMSYTLWQAVTNFATTANGVLASTFLLYSVGLGAGAIPTAGAMNWVLKDGLGQLGTLLFGKAIAHNFDIHSKTWYFMSFLLLSTATGLEIATILQPQWFLIMGSCANMIKGLSWMAGGSTRSVFNLSFVRDNNIADITAKNTSQYIFASLFGTTAGVSICAYIGQSAPLALLCFSGLAWTSIYSAYRTVKSIPLPTLNSTRLQLLAARYLKCIRTSSTGLVGFRGYMSYQQPPGYVSYQQEYEVPEDEDDTCELELPSPLDLAHQDPPLPWVTADRRILNPAIHVGTQLDKLVQGQPALLVVLLNTFRFQRYLLVPERNAIHMVLHAEAQSRDMMQAYLQACILRKCIKAGVQLSHDNIPELRIILHDTLLAAENLTPPFMRALARQGWQTEKIVVEAHRRRARW